jgi:hypothetical protein
MDDDWRLQIDLDDDGAGGKVADLMRSNELKNELEVDLKGGVIVSHEGERIFLYAGTREPLDWVRGVTEKFLDEKGWKASFELRHWHKAAEAWEDPDAPEPTTAAGKEAEHEQLIQTEDEEVAAHHGRAEFEVRVEFPSHTEAREFDKKLKEEGLEPVRRWHYLVVGAADEDAAKELADRIRTEAPADSKVSVEGSLAAAWGERPVNPFFFLGGLAG